MSKPFEPEEAKIAEEKTEKLVEILNNILKKYRAELGPQKDHDMAFICKGNPNIVIYVYLHLGGFLAFSSFLASFFSCFLTHTHLYHLHTF